MTGNRVQRLRTVRRAAGIGALLCLLSAAAVGAQQRPSPDSYPKISRLQRSDLMFRQLVEDINLFYRRQKSEGPLPPLAFFRYRVHEGDSIFTIAARFNLPYDAIASLNGLVHPEDCRTGKQLIIPNRPGIFIPRRPENAMEQLISGNNARSKEQQQPVTVRFNDEERSFYFVSDSRFNATERSFFLHVFFRLPLPEGQITSGYGSRTSPFTNRKHFHHGIDIAAEQGTEVVPARRGTVRRTGFDEVLGNYIVIEHEGGYSTTYGHLSKIVVDNEDQVQYGTIIGYVGSTGLSTGPHLHFEIRSGSSTRDPLQLIPVREQ